MSWENGNLGVNILFLLELLHQSIRLEISSLQAAQCANGLAALVEVLTEKENILTLKTWIFLDTSGKSPQLYIVWPEPEVPGECYNDRHNIFFRWELVHQLFTLQVEADIFTV